MSKDNCQQNIIPSVVSSVESSKLLIDISLCSCSFRALVDSGCSGISLIKLSAVQEIDATIEEDFISLKTADSKTKLHVVGSVVVPVRIGGLCADQLFYVVSDLCADVILGTDFLVKYKCSIDLGKMYLCSKEIGTISFLKNQLDFDACLTNHVILEPHSSSVVKFSCSGFSPDSIICFNPFDNLDNLYIPPCLTTVQPDNTFIATVHNTSIFPKAFKAKVVLGSVCAGSVVNNDLAVSSVCYENSNISEIFQIDKLPLKDNEKLELIKLLENHIQGISTSKDDIGQTNIIEHEINVKDNRPVRQGIRPLNPIQRKFVANEVDRLCKLGLVQPSKSPWSSPLVIVKKANGDFRMCVDYRKVNSLTVKDSYPIPRISDILDSLSGSQWFCTLDLRSGYYQVRMSEESRECTAFPTPNGHYEFAVLPFGLCNAPSTFQRLMDEVLRDYLFDGCIVYLDDVIVYGKNFDETLLRLGRVLEALVSAGLKLNAEKCQLFRKEVKFLGHKISSEGISTDNKKTVEIENWPTPSCVKDLQAFLGLANYYRRFIRSFSDIVAPLNKLLSVKDYVWSISAEEAFQKIKSLLVSAPILAYPDFSQDSDKFILDVDASNDCIGAILSQIQNKKECVIAYGSKTLSKSQRNYSTTHRELFSLVYFLDYFRQYLQFKPFLLRTDHSALTYLQNNRSNSSLLERWQTKIDNFTFSLLERMPEYNFEIVHRQGKRHGNADALSRKPQIKAEESSVNSVDNMVSDFVEYQQGNQEIVKIIDAIRLERKPTEDEIRTWSKSSQKLVRRWNCLFLRNNLLMLTRFEVDNCPDVIVVPPEKIGDICYLFHASPGGAHMGITATQRKLENRFWWPGILNDVADFIRCCLFCQSSKPTQHTAEHKLHPIPFGFPMDLVQIDIAGPMFPQSSRFSHALFIVDAFTGWLEVVPLADTDAVSVAKAFLNEWVSRFGAPERLLSDQGGNVAGEVIKSMCDVLGIKKIRTTPYHPQGNGRAERSIGTIKRLIRAMGNERNLAWDEVLPYALLAFRSAVNNSSGFTPHRLLFGREMVLPQDILSGNVENIPTSKYALDVRDNLMEMEKTARDNFSLARKRQAAVHQKKVRRQRCFREGDYVYRVNRSSSKKNIPRLGPYEVVEVMAHDVFKIRSQDAREHHQIIAVNGRDLVPLYETSRYSYDDPVSDVDSEATEIAVDDAY